MGSSTSKAAKSASKLSATNTARTYPTRSPPPSSNTTNAQTSRPTPDARLGPTVHPESTATDSRDQSIPPSSSDPDLSLNARLRTLGPVQPNPTLSNSSTYTFARSPPLTHSDRPSTNSSTSQTHTDPSLTHTQFQPSASNPAQSIFPGRGRENPAISLLTARYRLAEEAEREFAALGKKGSAGRGFVDVQTLRQVLVLRGEGMGGAEIEGRLGLKAGVVGRLG
ncbi:uncharacterized protein LY89DRAFT_627858, partial [Mollisia scopiformis]